MIPFACVLSRRKRSKNTTGDTTELHGIWSKMGFYLPRGSLWRSRPAYSLISTEIEDRHLRPSSIDGRRPRDTIANSSAPLDLHETAILALQFMIVWFLANYCLNLSLKLTSVASATTLSSASGFFTLALGAATYVEVFSLGKLSAVVMSFVGVLMVTRADSTAIGTLQPANAYLGDLLALASAFFYATYVVLLKKRIGDESRVSMPLFFGFVGVLNVIAMWPVGLVLHFTGVEVLQWPSGRVMWAGVVVNMCITFVSDMAYLLAMLKSSPIVATIGLSLTIPLAILGDSLRGAHTGGSQSYIGSIIVLLSFVAIGLADRAIFQQSSTPDSAIDAAGQQRQSRARSRVL
jgi:solute carrier family 35 protein F5